MGFGGLGSGCVGLGGLGSVGLDGLGSALLWVLAGLAVVVWVLAAWECCAVLALVGFVVLVLTGWGWALSRAVLIGLFLFKNLKKQIYQ